MTDNTTVHFGFRLLPPNATPDEVEQFSVGDRILMDTLFHHLLTAVRFDGSAVGSPAAPDPGEVGRALYSSEGYLPAGRTVWYRWTRVSAAGVESLPSTPVSVAIPPGLDTPAAPSVSFLETGGACYPGAWVYAVTAFKGAFAFDTPGSPAVVAHLEVANGDEQQVIITLPALPAGADGFNIYRQRPNSTVMQYLDTVVADDAADPYFDTGGDSPIPDTILTNRDSSGIGSKVRLTPVAPIPTGETMRFYRQFGSATGLWSQTFIGELTATDPDGYLEDLGGPSTTGAPPTRSYAFNNPPKRDINDETEGALAADRVAVIDIVGGTENNLPTTRLDGDVPYPQVQAFLHAQEFRGEGAATSGIPTEWVVPFAVIRPNGLTISVPVASAALTDDLIAELEVYSGSSWVGPVATVTLPQGGDRSAAATITTADLIFGIGYADFPAGTRFRINITQDGGAEDVTVQLAMAAKQPMAPFAWS